MIASIIAYLNQVVLPLGAGGVFLASVIEEVISPVPSPVVQMAAGFFFLSGPFSPSLLFTLVFVVVIPVALGVTVGSLVLYYLAYYAGKPLLLRWGRYIGISW